jgi:hypothetical protein
MILVYPEGLREKAEGTFPHVCFELADTTSNQFERIHLYVPQGFAIPDAATYNNVDLGVIGAGQMGQSGSGGLTESDTLAKSASLAGALPGGDTLGMAAQAQAMKAGVASNPFTNLAFTGTQVRSFNFTFKLIAESAKEAQTARKIEQLFRKFLYPEIAGSMSLKYPPQFKITFYNGEEVNQFMPKLMPCYLVSLSTTYNASTNSFHADGSPTEIDLALAFQETKALTRGDLFDIDDTAADSDLNYKSDAVKTNKKVG